ncbi:tRNA (N6-isopentenyl adenosine(37)-C2)-methylthiotransferase MiaB [Petrocella sp. FN5]|uniref:tRNA (N6-isopentenyl adenosine(37)-C2)-methylthiotransferase MiaB n=1 Tax=Petrocella sp. FN5 TaxID=3032002 RepID=UPI0023DC94CB|nr:tRNA (N6-isopentenyl adenosine(37)-C2)-methylthiotransferase MiaB [Petrocella sp. FN5]MDF1617539.1 tRNA (N6-isopentenyl adenosine(37)-C2)-methylthiotransferase MiaB [Petrocella sp. FN5]
MKRTGSVALSHEETLRQKAIIEKLKHRLKDRELTYFITTFGCQMNAHDSEMIKGILEDIGYREAVLEQEADFVIYNTCAVRENAEQRVYGRIGHLKSIKRKRPEMMIALCGCMMQQPTVIQELKKKHKHIDLVFGTHNLYKLAELLETRLDSGSAVYDIWDAHKEIVEDLPTIRKHRFKASVNIMYGCNNFCTYCIVPYVRGRERSRHPEDILKEITELVEDGVVEIMLLGQNVNSYGTGLDLPMTFAELIHEVEKVEGLRRIRFMTPHPKDLSDDLIQVMSVSQKICHHVHLPIQSGSTRLLKAMNRHYTKASYLDLVSRIKAKIPNVAITTDLIIGFPSETEADNEDTIDVIHQVEYNTAYTFIYSKRTGTPAANMEDQIPESVVKERFNKVLEAMDIVSLKNSEKHIGNTYELLVEEVNHKKADWVSGRLEDNHLVHVQGDESLIGTFVDVKIIGSKTYYLVGEII